MNEPRARLQPERFLRSEALTLALYRWPCRQSPAGDAPTVLLVHGYPDSAQVWQGVAERLSDHHNVFAYDVRGAGCSEAPSTTEGYALPHLMGDLAVVLDAIGPQQPVHLVAHDWGSIACWEAVSAPQFEGRFASYTSLSGPGLDLVGAWLHRRLREGGPRARREVTGQLLHSWYIVLFQLPGLAPLVWKAGLSRLWPRVLRRIERLGTEHHNPTQTRDGVNGIGLYRANITARLRRPAPRVTDIPVQLLVPRHDPFVNAAMLSDVQRYAPNLIRHDLDGGHWLPLSQPALVADKVQAFIAALTPPRRRAASLRAKAPAGAAKPRPRSARKPAR